MLPILNDAEIKLLESVTFGNVADLKTLTNQIHPEVFRYLLLGLPDPSIPKRLRRNGKLRWVIHGANFQDRLDLRDARSVGGGPLAALEFVGCIFNNGINADGAHFERLRFADCQFRYPSSDESNNPVPSTPISLRNALIVGELRFKDIAPSSEHALLWIHAKGIRIGTNARFHNVRLRAPKNEQATRDGTTRYALDMDGAKILAGLKLHPGVVCEGGVRLQNARIGGHIWADGLEASDGEDATTRAEMKSTRKDIRYAFDAQSARIGGALVLRSYVADVDEKENLGDSEEEQSLRERRCTIVGNLRTFGAKVSGGIFLDGLSMPGTDIAGSPQKQAASLELTSGEIGGSVSMGAVELPFGQMRPTVFGSMYLSGTVIQGDASIDAELSVLSLEGCVVNGNFNLRGSVGQVEAPHLSVSRDVILASTIVPPYILNLKRSNFGGVLDISRLKFDVTFSVTMREVRLRGISVARTLSVVPYPPVFSSAKKIDLLCWPEYSMIELRVKKNANSDADRDWWGGGDTAYATFLCNRATNRGIVISMGQTPYIGEAILLSPLQQCAKIAMPKMNFSSDSVVRDYIRFFCSCISVANLDFFSVVEKPDDLPVSLRGIQVSPLSSVERGNIAGLEICRVSGFMRHRGFVSKVVFVVHRSGLVELDAEEKLKAQDVRESRHYADYFRFGEDSERPNYNPLSQASPVSRRDFEKVLPLWRDLLLVNDRFANTLIDLRDASCTTLEDGGGQAWEGAKLLLENFIYSRLLSPGLEREIDLANESKKRMQFLRLRPAEEYLQLIALSHFVRKAVLPFQLAKSTFAKGVLEEALHELNLWSSATESTYVSALPRDRVTKLIEELATQDDSWKVFSSSFDNLTAANKPIQDVFQPQPYAQLAKVLREQGDEHGAREVEREKMRLEAELRIANDKRTLAIAWSPGHQMGSRSGLGSALFSVKKLGNLLRSQIWNQVYGYGFGYGLSLGRASITIVAFWVIGWLAVAEINHSGYLVASSATVTSIIANTGEGDTPVLLKTSDLSIPPNYIEELPCKGKVNQLLYAVETFTPLLNLRQETRCEIRSPHIKEKVPLIPRLLEFAKFVYEILGYVITSLAVLTFSGIARRWDQ